MSFVDQFVKLKCLISKSFTVLDVLYSQRVLTLYYKSEIKDRKCITESNCGRVCHHLLT